MFKEYCEKNPTEKEQEEKINKLTKLQMEKIIQEKIQINPKLINLKKKGDELIKKFKFL